MINTINKKIISLMLSLGLLGGLVTALAEETPAKKAPFETHVSVSQNIIELIRNTEGVRSGTDTSKFQGATGFTSAEGDDNGNKYLKMNPNTAGYNGGMARFDARTVKANLPGFSTVRKIVIENKMRIDSISNIEGEEWLNIGIAATIPTWGESGTAIPLAAVSMADSESKALKVRLGGFENTKLTAYSVIDKLYPAGEFINYKITIDTPENGGENAVISYEINGEKQDFIVSLPISDLSTVYGAGSTSNALRIIYGTQNSYAKNNSAEITCSVDDLIVTAYAGEIYSKSADFTTLTKLPSDFISSANTAAPVFDGNNGVKFGVSDKDQYVCSKTNGKYLASYGKPFVVETRVKFDPFDDKGQLRIQARGRDSVNGTGAYNQAGTLALMTFNRGSIVLKSNMNPQPEAPYSVKIGEFEPDIWYNVRLIFSIADEKMYAYVYTDDYSYKTAGVVKIPIEEMYNYNLESLSEINSLGVFSGSSNGGRATSYVSNFKMYAADITEGRLEYIADNTQKPEGKGIRDAVKLTFSDVVDLTQLNMTVKCGDTEYTNYKAQLEGDGKTLVIAPSSEWDDGNYTVTFNDKIKGYFGGECEVGAISFAISAPVETAVRFVTDEGQRSAVATINDVRGTTKNATMYFAAYNEQGRLISVDYAKTEDAKEIMLSNLSPEVSYFQVFVWSDDLDYFTDAEVVNITGS